MLNWIRILYCKRRLHGALADSEYWLKEVERTKANVGIANNRVEHWRAQLHNARYPVRGLVMPAPASRRKRRWP